MLNNLSGRWRALVAGAAVMLAMGSANAVAQSTRGSVAGTVRDGQGAAVPGATVELTSPRRNDTQVTTANEAGDFVFLNLLPDNYNLKVTMDSFKTVEQSNVVLNAADRLSVGVITLELGAVSETVNVTTRVVEVQSRDAARNFSVDSAAIENLAVNGRDPLLLARLAPGIADASAGTGMNVNGARDNTTNYTVDGVSNLDTGNNGVLGSINLDAVEEFKILTNAYAAEYGRSSGAQISLVTKSGGRDYRGSAYGYRRQESFNANSFINNRERGRALQTDPASRVGLKAINRQTDLGFTVGGPVPLGGYNKDKNRLFFFFAFENQRRFTPPANPNRVKVPTDLERQGDFSQSVDNNNALFNLIKDYQTGLPCTATNTSGCFQDGGVLGRIPANRLYAPGMAILNAYPKPNASGAGYNYESQVAVQIDRREEIFRADWQASSAWRVYGRYFENSNNAGTGVGPYGSFVLGANVPLTNVSDIRPVYNLSLSATGVISPTLFFETTFGTGHNSIFIHDADGTWTRSGLGVSALPVLYPDAVQDDYPPQINLGGRFGTSPNIGSNNAPFYNFNTTYDFLANLTKVWGRHTSKFGVYAQKSLKDQSGFGANNGNINFSNDTANPFDTGYSAANAAIGVFNTFQQASVYPIGEYRYWNVEWYLQDNWKVNDRLTLDYGLRFYWVQPQHDVAGLTSNFAPELFNQSDAVRLYRPAIVNGTRVAQDPVTGQTLPAALIGRIVPQSGSLTNGIGQGGQNGVPDRLIEDNGVLFAPRFGMTYDITGNQSFIFRLGGGVFYDRYEGNIAFDEIVNPPTTFEPRITWGRLQEIDPASALLAPSNLNAMQLAGNIPTTYSFNMGFQKKLPGGMIWDIAYVGSLQNHLPRRVNANAVPYGATFAPQNQDTTLPASSNPGQTALAQDFLRPYLGYGNINLRLFDANANYHGLQTQIDRRFANGLFLNANYTFSKALDTQDGNGDFSRIDGFDKQANYGPAGFDRRHIVNLNWVYQVPKMETAGVLLGGLVNNWQISGGYRLESGLPYGLGWSVNGVGNRNITGSDTEGSRIVITGDPGSGHSDDPYQQVAQGIYAPAAVGSIGLESGRNYLNRAPLNNVDLSLEKGFGLGGRRRLAFRVDAFNVLNHTQFDAVANNIQFTSLTNLTPVNLPYNAAGELVRTNGFGSVTSVRSPRVLQLLARFQF
ncbi:MAG: carboxypeptidase regulatory-like domain-containing protein [Vicinamibacteraceae bacterium]